MPNEVLTKAGVESMENDCGVALGVGASGSVYMRSQFSSSSRFFFLAFLLSGFFLNISKIVTMKKLSA